MTDSAFPEVIEPGQRGVSRLHQRWRLEQPGTGWRMTRFFP